jgi:enoyl-CoA hydratase
MSHTTYTTFELVIDQHIAHLRLCRPEQRNTMNMRFWPEIAAAFAEIDARSDVRAVIISSTGKHFTAGLDLMEFSSLLSQMPAGDRGRTSEQLRRLVLRMQESFNAVERCRVPVIAAVQGGCVGGGVDLISACDLRCCTEDAFFSIAEINIGITADLGTLQRLPKLIPEGVVRELAYTGRRLPASRAYQIGLVNEVAASHEALLSSVTQLAREIAAKSPLAIAGTKEMLRYTRDHSVEDVLRYVATWQAGMLFTADVLEQILSNQEKRPPAFEDLLAEKHITA